jgi:hypothetical protein
MGSNSRVQYEKVWLTCERIRLTFGLFSFFPSFMVFSIFCVFFKTLTTHNGWTYAQDIDSFCLYNGHASNDCTSVCSAMSNYWTILDYDD